MGKSECCDTGCSNCTGTKSTTYKLNLSIGGMHPHNIEKRFALQSMSNHCPILRWFGWSITITGTPIAGDVISLWPFVTVVVTTGMISGGLIQQACIDALNADDTTGFLGPDSWIITSGIIYGPLDIRPALLVTNQPGSTLTVTVASTGAPVPDLHNPQDTIISLTGSVAFLPSFFTLYATYGRVDIPLSGVTTLTQFAAAIATAMTAQLSTIEAGEVTYTQSGTNVYITASAGTPFVVAFSNTLVSPNGRITIGGVTVRISRSTYSIKALKTPKDFIPEAACCVARTVKKCGTDPEFWSGAVIHSREYDFEGHVHYSATDPITGDTLVHSRDTYGKTYLSQGVRRCIREIVISICPVIGPYGELLWEITCGIAGHIAVSRYYSGRTRVIEDSWCTSTGLDGIQRTYCIKCQGIGNNQKCGEALGRCATDETSEENSCGGSVYLPTPITDVALKDSSTTGPAGPPFPWECPPGVLVIPIGESRTIRISRTCTFPTLTFPKTSTTACGTTALTPNSHCVGWDGPVYISACETLSTTGGNDSPFVNYEPLSKDDWIINLIPLP